MHTEMAEHEGTFDVGTRSNTACRKCKKTNVVVKKWDSGCGGYTDYKYRCDDCGHVWWTEGADA